MYTEQDATVAGVVVFCLLHIVKCHYCLNTTVDRITQVTKRG